VGGIGRKIWVQAKLTDCIQKITKAKKDWKHGSRTLALQTQGPKLNPQNMCVIHNIFVYMSKIQVVDMKKGKSNIARGLQLLKR
jgi:hypothetical protein